MEKKKFCSISSLEIKPHYNVLDGLRGVAALMVVCFHILEAYTTSHLDQKINHGYLAVDFFFLLSGFVIGYAYDDRWKTMTIKEFIKRRFIRLHPMVFLGAILGGIMFYFQGCGYWDDVSKVSITILLIATVLNALLIPMTPGTEIRGLTEMYPLNGPTWSLFFEYIGNLLYAFFIRKFSIKILSIFVVVSGCGLAAFAIFGQEGDICIGWSMDKNHMLGGSLRFLFSFSAGLLLSRIFKPIPIKGTFWICSLLIIILLSIPRIGGIEDLWKNGLYDIFCCTIAFPLLVYMGASDTTTQKTTIQICKFLGNISYPLYIIHYPFIYLYYAWVKNKNLTFIQSLPGALTLFLGTILLVYLCLKLYDQPIRKFLTQHLLRTKKG
ncbi:MAG: acyltransferase family protein [Chitinophagaceae bacterium]